MGKLQIGSARQLFVDDLLVDHLKGVRLHLHEPQPRERVLSFEQPWEGDTSWCPVILYDEGLYRMWYRAQKGDRPARVFTAYAESRDGIGWERPDLGLFVFDGTKNNNICIDNDDMKNVAVFLDQHPDAPAEKRYKAVGRWTRGQPSRIFGMVSADGIHWRMAQQEPLISAPTEDPHFDSPLSAFWDARLQRYAIYVRGWFPDGPERRIRAIRMTTSPDFVHWEPWSYIRIERHQPWPFHLYTNAAQPYYRAPYYLMFPKRYIPERKFLAEWSHDGLSDVLFLASRDGAQFFWPGPQAFLRPGPDLQNWHVRSIFFAPHVLPAGGSEMAFYSVQNYRTTAIHLCRFTLRVDGFVSARADAAGGTLLTKPLVFAGARLQLNYATSAAGSLQVEILDADEQPIPGFSTAACGEIFGDELERIVEWRENPDLEALTGRPVRLRFLLREADLYSFKFT